MKLLTSLFTPDAVEPSAMAGAGESTCTPAVQIGQQSLPLPSQLASVRYESRLIIRMRRMRVLTGSIIMQSCLEGKPNHATPKIETGDPNRSKTCNIDH